jgi:hypothetical protein
MAAARGAGDGVTTRLLVAVQRLVRDAPGR